jgi:hypothetical protein
MRKLAGSRRAFHAFATEPSRSRSNGKRSGIRPMNLSMRDTGSARFTASTWNGWPSSALRRASIDGISARHGSHQVAQKFTSTTLPR